MVMALGAGDRHAQQRTGDDLQRVGDDLIASLGRIVAAAGAVGRHPQKSGRRQQFDLLGRHIARDRPDDFIARQLLENEPIERFVRVESADHVIAIFVRPTANRVLGRGPFAIGVAGGVEPVPRPALAIMRRGEQTIDEPLVGVGRSVGEKFVDVVRLRRESEQIEIGALDQRVPV